MRENAGKYEPLHKYLRDRYADRVVLSFTQIEDLIGFPLPRHARDQPEWWNDAADWTLAGRTAAVNIPARHVTFDRDTTRPVRAAPPPLRR